MAWNYYQLSSQKSIVSKGVLNDRQNFCYSIKKKIGLALWKNDIVVQFAQHAYQNSVQKKATTT